MVGTRKDGARVSRTIKYRIMRVDDAEPGWKRRRVPHIVLQSDNGDRGGTVETTTTSNVEVNRPASRPIHLPVRIRPAIVSMHIVVLADSTRAIRIDYIVARISLNAMCPSRPCKRSNKNGKNQTQNSETAFSHSTPPQWNLWSTVGPSSGTVNDAVRGGRVPGPQIEGVGLAGVGPVAVVSQRGTQAGDAGGSRALSSLPRSWQ